VASIDVLANVLLLSEGLLPDVWNRFLDEGGNVLSLLSIVALVALRATAFAQNTSNNQEAKENPTRRAHVDQSIVVGAHLTPEEAEEGKINGLYQPVYKFEREGNCDGIIETDRSAIIPAAERAKFERVRNKFLFMSYRGIGNCLFKMKQFAEAEQTYIKAVDYADKDDDSYPINYESIALCRMAQQQLDTVEEPLQKAVSLLGEQIQHFKKSDTYDPHDVVANDVRDSQDVALTYLAVLRFRQQRFSDAFSLLDQAYEQAIKFQARNQSVELIVGTARTIAIAIGDDAANAVWIKRSPISN
jgi:tetratricopeptide (TPR) repeat protein